MTAQMVPIDPPPRSKVTWKFPTEQVETLCTKLADAATTMPGLLDNHARWQEKRAVAVRKRSLRGLESSADFQKRMKGDKEESDSKPKSDFTKREESDDGAEDSAVIKPEVKAEPPTYDDRRLEASLKFIHAGAKKALQDPTQKTEHCISDELIPELETLPQSDGTLFKLRPHQRDGIGQLEYLEQENSAWILGDEPGLGKTAQVIGLIARSKPGTLIVCPKPLLSMWEAECGRLPSKVLAVYTGKDRQKLSLEQLRKAHVVLTSYEVVQSEFTEIETVENDWSLLRKGQTTKVLKIKGKRHSSGKGKAKLTPDAEEKEVNLMHSRSKGNLFAIDWYRVVLEEGHKIKTARSITSRACARLGERATMKGCITGTPFQNDYTDFYSMLRFMHLEPFDGESLFKRCFLKKVDTGFNPSGTATLSDDLELALIALRRCVTVRRTKDQMFDGERITGLLELKEIQIPVKLGDKNQEIRDKKKRLWDLAYCAWHKADPEEEKSGSFYQALTEGQLEAINPHLVNAKYGDCGRDDGEHIKDAKVADDEGEEKQNEKSGIDAMQQALRGENGQLQRRQGFKAWCLLQATGAYSSELIEATANQMEYVIKKEEYDAEQQPTDLEKRKYRRCGKILGFCSFLTANDALKLALKKRGIKVYELNGHTKGKDREEILRKFEELNENGTEKDFSKPETKADRYRVLLASPRVAVEGLNLKQAAYVFFLGLY
ncbi:putative helicase, P-loop containing nucleoside triphosphate hydrolase, SNF2-like domain superfamily [Septoria linicola]|nr:putative helicase, P-loop containing nucleoside triphosphate hydrolase, SNF2-like domain superfamily [Septoria linicola]